MSDIETTARLAELHGLQTKILALREKEEDLKQRADDALLLRVELERALWNKLADLNGVDGQLEDGEPVPPFTTLHGPQAE
ncbi:hypothetical protein RSO41_06085 [Halomonas sp. I1]|uniref:hypothetical protein n=1 Tax=Halomonas sp. I1 TaxID=393536 RepID=UPI0028DF5D2E|nr:hypothetical protein [Halomonas sp. I1]MDT8894219.1 hypothetical protein [Halomonas sp. I1]